MYVCAAVVASAVVLLLVRWQSIGGVLVCSVSQCVYVLSVPRAVSQEELQVRLLSVCSCVYRVV